jgi:hypothetical protein
MIKDLYLIPPDMANPSQGYSPLCLHLPLVDSYFGYKQKFLKNTLVCLLYSPPWYSLPATINQPLSHPPATPPPAPLALTIKNH